jgi:N utilization substance protein B
MDFVQAKKELLKSVEQMYRLYLSLLLTFSELKSQGEHRLAENKKKLLPTEDDLNPNRKFVDNTIIQILEEQPELRHQAELLKVNWLGAEEQEIFRKMYNNIRKSETYFEFMDNGEVGFEADKSFAIQLFKHDIANFQALYDYYEEKSIYWMDDIDLACAMVIKTIKSFKEEGENTILPLYKPNDDEKDFIETLLKETIKLEKENLVTIDKLTKNWELDRIAKMDVLLMEMAITELRVFPNIPTKVTLNEYIEISKFYSTPKSNVFINGVLDKAISQLEEKGKIRKMGRGLMK